MRWLSHYASFINAPCHRSLLTSFLTVGKQSGGTGGRYCAQRGQGRKAVVPHLEWDSNKPAAAMETGEEPPRILRAGRDPKEHCKLPLSSLARVSLALSFSVANGPEPPTRAPRQRRGPDKGA